MKLRDLMIERIRFALTESDLIAEFGVNFEDLEVLPVEDFLDLYDTMFTFQG
jgi:hypothetical protein